MNLPASICFRVTRSCNARCVFCLAPPTGNDPDTATLIRRIDRLHDRQVRKLDFCGGEPTIRPDLPELIKHADGKGFGIRLTTNGITMHRELPKLLQRTRAKVRVSLHGDCDHHDQITGVPSFDRATETIRRLTALRIHTTVQTVVSADNSETIEWMSAHCLRNGIKHLNFMALIPRGNSEGRLSIQQRNDLKNRVKEQRSNHAGQLHIQWLDFNANSITVVETDGRIIREGASEVRDELIGEIA